MPRGFAVQLYFDAALENQVLKIWNSLARRGISSLLIDIGARPHISLAVYADIDLAKVKTALKDFASSQLALSLTLQATGSFNSDEGVIFLSPVPTAELLDLHQRFHTMMKKLGALAGPNHCPGTWFPHCTIAQEVEKDRIGEVLSICREFRLPINGELCEVGIVEFRPVREHFTFPFKAEV